jgi:hypothetical protein
MKDTEERGKQSAVPLSVAKPQNLSTVTTKIDNGESFDLPDEKKVKPLAVITWEDITAYARVEIPEDFEKYRLLKKTVGLIWAEAEDYLVLVQDYDMTNKGKSYRHNDFHIIPKGVIREIKYLGHEHI